MKGPLVNMYSVHQQLGGNIHDNEEDTRDLHCVLGRYRVNVS